MFSGTHWQIETESLPGAGAIESASQFRLWTGVFAPGLDKSLEIV